MIEPALGAVNSRSISGKYRLEAELGSGAMGTVYRARQLSLNRTVALKLLKLEATENLDGFRRFAQEAKLLMRLSHPNIVRVFDVELEGDPPYIAMEYVEGSSLQDVLEQPARFPRPDPVGLARELAEGLAYVHSQGALHRDLKPANILLDVGRHGKLADFGLARAADSATLTSQGFVVGTPAYLAPEQFTRGVFNEQTDLYQLGLVLYELTQGKSLLEQADFDLRRAMAVRLEGRLPRLSTFVEGCPTALSDAVMRCVERDPAIRFQSASELMAALGQLPAASSQLLQTASVRQFSRRPAAHATSGTRKTAVQPLPPGPRRRWAWPGLLAGLLLGGFLSANLRWPATPRPAPTVVAVASLEVADWTFETAGSILRLECKLSAPVVSGYRVGSVVTRFESTDHRAAMGLSLPRTAGTSFDIQLLRNDGGPDLRWTQKDLVARVREKANRTRTALAEFWRHSRLDDQSLVDQLRRVLGSKPIPTSQKAAASRRLREYMQREFAVFAAVQELLPLAPLVFDEPAISAEERLATYRSLAPLTVVDAVSDAYGLDLVWNSRLSTRLGHTFRQVNVPRTEGMNSYAWTDFGGKEMLFSSADWRVPGYASMPDALLGAQYHFDSIGVLKLVVNDVPLYFDLVHRYHTPPLPIPVLMTTGRGGMSGPGVHGVVDMKMATLAHGIEPSTLRLGSAQVSASAIWIHPPGPFDRNRVQLLWVSFPVR